MPDTNSSTFVSIKTSKGVTPKGEDDSLNLPRFSDEVIRKINSIEESATKAERELVSLLIK